MYFILRNPQVPMTKCDRWLPRQPSWHILPGTLVCMTVCEQILLSLFLCMWLLLPMGRVSCGDVHLLRESSPVPWFRYRLHICQFLKSMTLPHVQWFGLGLTPHTTIYKVYNDREDNDSLYLATSHITELYVRFYSVVFGGLFYL